jgi:hypothetical protein
MNRLITAIAITLAFFHEKTFSMNTNTWKQLNKHEKRDYLLKKIRRAKEIQKKRLEKFFEKNNFDDTYRLQKNLRHDKSNMY